MWERWLLGIVCEINQKSCTLITGTGIWVYLETRADVALLAKDGTKRELNKVPKGILSET